MLFPLLGIVLRQAVHQVCQHLIVLVVGIGRISADPFPIELMLICGRILRKDLLRDKLIAQRAGKDRRHDLRLSFLVSDTKHIRGIGQIIKSDRCLLRLLLRDSESRHVRAVDIHLTVQDRMGITREQAHSVEVFRLRRADGKYLCIVKKIQIILYHIIFKFFMIQTAVRDSLYKRRLVIAVPDLLCCL